MAQVVIGIGLLVSAFGLLGVVAPGVTTKIGLWWDSTAKLWLAAVVRLGIGTLLILAAPDCRMPGFVRFFGALVVVVGVATPLVGPARIQRMACWWAAQPEERIRFWSGAVVVFGAFISWAGGAQLFPRMNP